MYIDGLFEYYFSLYGIDINDIDKLVDFVKFEEDYCITIEDNFDFDKVKSSICQALYLEENDSVIEPDSYICLYIDNPKLKSMLKKHAKMIINNDKRKKIDDLNRLTKKQLIEKIKEIENKGA